MSKCDTCKKTGCFHRSSTVVGCSQYVAKDKTNADRIRDMTDEELAAYLVQTILQQCPCPTKDCEARCNDCILKWLQQPAEEDSDGNQT